MAHARPRAASKIIAFTAFVASATGAYVGYSIVSVLVLDQVEAAYGYSESLLLVLSAGSLFTVCSAVGFIAALCLTPRVWFRSSLRFYFLSAVLGPMTVAVLWLLSPIVIEHTTAMLLLAATALVITVASLLLAFAVLFLRHVPPTNSCQWCGYILRCRESGQCPECGRF